MAEGLKYEQEELWAAIQRLHRRLVKLEVVHETKRSLPELAQGDCGTDARDDIAAIVQRFGEKP
jgi:hypothetical protein